MQRKKFIKKIAAVTFSVFIAGAVIFTEPVLINNVLAAVMEDCDLDGYDDHTGKPVPWRGFDGTKGDTVPSDWDGVSDSYYQSNSSGDDSKSDDSSSNSTGTSTNSGQSKASSSGGSSSSSKSNTRKKSSGSSSKTSSVSKGNSSTGTGKKTSGSIKRAGTEENGAGSIEETTIVEEITTKNTEKKKKSKKSKTKTVGNKEQETTGSNTDINDVESVIEDAVLQVEEADGSLIHAGSSVILYGSGLTGSIADIQIEIHSDNAIDLGRISSGEDGSFETQVKIPENLEEGQHEIVLLYNGTQIASAQINVGPKVADTFLKAATVGFTTDNKGFVPGLIILAVLAVVGAVTLIGGKIFGKKA